MAKPTMVHFNTYDNATGPKFQVAQTFRINVAGMSVDECIALRNLLEKSNHVGTVTIFLDNGKQV